LSPEQVADWDQLVSHHMQPEYRPTFVRPQDLNCLSTATYLMELYTFSVRFLALMDWH